MIFSSMAKTDLDFKYVTTRVAVMSFPADGLVESTYKNPIDEVKAFLDNRHYNRYAIFNLSQRRYRADKFFNRVIQIGFWTFGLLLHLINWVLRCQNVAGHRIRQRHFTPLFLYVKICICGSNKTQRICVSFTV